MASQHDHIRGIVAEAVQREWDRLRRLCVRLSGDRQAAEDLAQETVAIAWLRADSLRDPEAVSAWLSGIARNVCRQWNRHHRRERDRAISLEDAGLLEAVPFPTANTSAALQQLEHAQLVAFLNQALALLTPETRRLLIARYVDETSYQDLSMRLGQREQTTMVQAHRAKRRLRDVLIEQFYPDVSIYAPNTTEAGGLETFELFCPLCGRAHLIGRFDATRGMLVLRCPRCQAGRPDTVANAIDPTTMEVVKGAPSVETALPSVRRRISHHYTTGSTTGAATCLYCGATTNLHKVGAADDTADDVPGWFRHSVGFFVHCQACGKTSAMGVRSLARCSPPGREFWRRHARMRTLPVQRISYHGRPAMLVQLESLTDADRLDLVLDATTYRLLGQHA